MNKITIKENNNALEITIKGDLNIHNIDPLLNDYKQLITRKPSVIGINCENLSSVDSSGLGALISMAKLAEKEGVEFFICVVNKKVSTPIVITKINKKFDIICRD